MKFSENGNEMKIVLNPERTNITSSSGFVGTAFKLEVINRL
jgi:hypothetical protein